MRNQRKATEQLHAMALGELNQSAITEEVEVEDEEYIVFVIWKPRAL